MIAARITAGKRCSLAVDGHAGYAPRGRDIICAAVSGLVYALAGGLQTLDANAEIWLEPGRCRIACPGSTEACAMFRMAQAGLEQLAAEFPEHVAVAVRNGGKTALKTPSKTSKPHRRYPKKHRLNQRKE